MGRIASVSLFAAVLVAASMTACAPTQTVVSDPPIERSDPPVVVAIDGLYEVTITEAELSEAGVTDPATLAEHAGTYYWTFDDGQWVYEQQSDKPLEVPGAIGTYELDGNSYTHLWSDDPGDSTSATLTVLSDQSLQFTDIVDADPDFQIVSEVLFGLHPWMRLGDPQ